MQNLGGGGGGRVHYGQLENREWNLESSNRVKTQRFPQRVVDAHLTSPFAVGLPGNNGSEFRHQL